jgi:hypothetical protein
MLIYSVSAKGPFVFGLKRYFLFYSIDKSSP